jgi:hypothetical protein
MRVYLQGQDDLTGFSMMKIVKGEATGVDIDLAAMEKDYRAMPFELFAEVYVKPALANLFRQEDSDGNGSS